MSKKFLISIATLLIIAFFAGVAIFFAKGYTFSPKERRIVGTGIINITSQPDAASVFIDGHLTTSTNATISSLSPKSYTVRVVKEGFIPWEKSLEVKEGVVTEVKLTLFPAIPTIYPLTFTSVVNPALSPDGSKLTYVVPAKEGDAVTNKKGGVWVWTMVSNQPIAFARSSEPHQIASNTTADFSKAVLKWSPDSKQVLANVGNNNYLLESNNLNDNPRDITPVLVSTIKSWEDDTKAKKVLLVESIADEKLKKIASDSAIVKWSPDETKFMAGKSSDKTNLKAESEAILKTDGSIKVYDLEDGKEYDLPPAKAHIWLPESKHIILVEEGSISVADFDGTNKAVIYAGNFLDDFVFPWPDSSRFVIINSLPTPTASEPNFYGVNLK